jgi:hypothetical protein
MGVLSVAVVWTLRINEPMNGRNDKLQRDDVLNVVSLASLLFTAGCTPTRTTLVR